MTDRLAELSAAGVAVWLDDLSRVRLQSGSLDKMRREQHVVGVTTNPTIFAKALADADAYDSQLKDLAAQQVTVEEAVRLLTAYDVRWACDVMKPAYDASNGVDGRVSIEVDPRSAHLTPKTQSEAKTLWWLVDRPNLYIKIPATEAGLPAITATLAEGISVNVTLIFSLERYQAVMEAFLAGVEQAKANGHDLTKLGSVASFFVSRVDTEIDKRLDKIGSEEAKALKGKAAIANAQLAYKAYAEVFASDRWQALLVAFVGTGLSVTIGVTMGMIAGFYRGWVDTVIARVIDVLLAFPVLLLGLGLASACSTKDGCLGGALEPGLKVVLTIIVISNWPYVARIIRGQVLSLREKEFVEASKSLGASNAREFEEKTIVN